MLLNPYAHGDPPVRRLLESLPWYTDSEKLEFEKRAVREGYEDQFSFKKNKYGEIYLEGIISTPSLSTLVLVRYPRYYPLFWPSVYPVPPRILSPHINPDLSMCLFYPSDDVERSWNPFKDTTADILKMSFEWLFKQGYWEITEQWPGKTAPHGGKGIPVYLQEIFQELEKKSRKKDGKKNRRKLQKLGKGEQLDI